MVAFRLPSKFLALLHCAARRKYFQRVCATLLVGLRPCVSAGQDEAHFFETHVRPVLVEKCIGCHGDQKQSGGLRLDSREAILKGGDSGAAMIPGDVSASHMIQAIRYDGDLQMPPKNELPDAEKQALIQWVESGAVWPQDAAPLKTPRADLAKTHWAFQPVTRPEVPAIAAADPAQIRTPIDAFILAKLTEVDLTLSAEADRRTLIRRAFYTLTGLPPTAADVENFVNDVDPMAYENLVDRLLASPTHGQHWARHWLDIARYSDTKGYVYAREERFWIHAWSYRDWVVDAFNANMPYDRFLLLQLAADQVLDRTDEDLAAMGFLTLGRRFQGVRRDIIDDRIDVVCRGTMALTVGCARCHDHKYDPIPTADYYSLYGVFDSCREKIVPLPDARMQDDAFAAELKKRTDALAALRQERRVSTSARVRSRIGDYLQAQRELQKYPEEGFDQILALDDLLPSFVHRWRDYLRDAGLRHDPVFVAWHRYADIPDDQYSQRAAGVTQALLALSADRINPRVAAAFAAVPTSFTDVIARYTTLFKDLDAKWQADLKTAAAQGAAIHAMIDPADEQLRTLLYGPGSLCEVPDEPVVNTEYDFDSGTCTELWKLQGEVDRLIINAASEPRFATIIEDREVPSSPRIFKRGNSANKGDDVPRRFLELLSGPDRKPFEHGSGRLEMAQAIIDPSNPLTARVIVNRVWAHHFGAGLVTTPGDFGIRAEPPSHPALLDWLTSEFIASGWNLKALHHMIVLSAAYRQSSDGPADAAQLVHARAIDPENRLLWHMNVHRLSFEEMRDSMLAVSGQLDQRSGGKPSNLFSKPFPVRRTLYGLVDRQYLPGTLRMFDFANPDLPIPKRSETTVPQQSLFLMNDPLALERARALAASLPVELSADDRIRTLYRSVLQRDPTAAQLTAARELLAADVPEKPAASITAADWSYGFGTYDEASQRVSDFAALPHFTGNAWQGGEAWPDAVLGWVQLTAKGGHPGNDRAHASVRRWTAPAAMTITIQSELRHEPPPPVGDGIRAFIVSSKTGSLQSTKAHQQTLPLNVESQQVMPGDTIDLVVDIGDTLNSDQYLWTCRISEAEAESRQSWNSDSDFPHEANDQLSPLEQLAQVLLCSNEFLFVD